MANDPISDYLKAFQEMGEARRRAQVFVDVITNAAFKFQKEWRRVRVTDVENVEFGIAQDLHIHGAVWPNSQELAEVLAEYRKAVLAAGSAYRRIPEAQRGVVTAPPENRYG
jgi:hypothetical protein